MKDHTSGCNVTSTGVCTCTGTDTLILIEEKKELIRECERYLEKIEELATENAELKEENLVLAEYPWGRGWTYWLVSAVAGSVSLALASIFIARVLL